MSVRKIDLNNEDYNKLINSQSNKFNSTMLDIVKKRTDKISPSDILRNYQNNYSYYQPAINDPRIYNDITRDFYNSVENDFECIELSPVSPIALNCTLTETNQNNVLSTIRNSEVISDSSIVMALECAYRIKNGWKSDINLASSTRLLRMQNYGNGKKSHWSQHFRACSLVSSFRNTKDNMYNSLVLQIDNWLKAINKFNLDINDVDVNICYLPIVKEIYNIFGINESTILDNSVNPNFDIFEEYDICINDKISNVDQINKFKVQKDCLLSIKNSYLFFEDKVLNVLKKLYPKVNFNFHLNRKSGLNYYEHLCYEIVVHFKDGKDLCLVDGGITNWTGQLLSDSKEKCVTSGMGLEYISKVYKR